MAGHSTRDQADTPSGSHDGALGGVRTLPALGFPPSQNNNFFGSKTCSMKVSKDAVNIDTWSPPIQFIESITKMRKCNITWSLYIYVLSSVIPFLHPKHDPKQLPLISAPAPTHNNLMRYVSLCGWPSFNKQTSFSDKRGLIFLVALCNHPKKQCITGKCGYISGYLV